MFFVEDNNFLTEYQKNYIDKFILGPNFPFYWSDWAVKPNDGIFNFTHKILERPEKRKEGEYFNSNQGIEFVNIFETFCKKNNIKYKEILRICVNLNLNIGIEKAEVHKDHLYDYKHLIVYLNEFEEGETYLFDDDKKTITKTIKPKKYKGVAFDSCWHSASPPKKGRRVIIVYTFI